MQRVEFKWMMPQVQLLLYNINLIEDVTDIYQLSSPYYKLKQHLSVIIYILPLLNTHNTQDSTKKAITFEALQLH